MSSLTEKLDRVPDIWLRAFYGFDPANDGAIGWTKEPERNYILQAATPGDLFLIYGAESDETQSTNRRQVLGLLQIDLEPIDAVTRQSEDRQKLTAENGWEDKWIHAVPVRRAWRIDRRIEVRHVAPVTYIPEMARVMGRERARLTKGEVEQVLQLPVTEMSVWGEPPLPEPGPPSITLGDALAPSRGITPSFGAFEGNRSDGAHKLYMLKFEGDTAALLGRHPRELVRKALVKVGYSNDPARRCSEVNAGIPPAASHRWTLWVQSADYPNGETAIAAEDTLKSEFDRSFESLGGEFFLGDEIALQVSFSSIEGTAAFTIKTS